MTRTLDRSTAFRARLGVYHHLDGRTGSSWYYKRPGDWLYEFEDSSRHRVTFETAAEFRAFLQKGEWFDATTQCGLCLTTTEPLNRYRAQGEYAGKLTDGTWQIAYCPSCTPKMVTQDGYLKPVLSDEGGRVRLTLIE